MLIAGERSGGDVRGRWVEVNASETSHNNDKIMTRQLGLEFHTMFNAAFRNTVLATGLSCACALGLGAETLTPLKADQVLARVNDTEVTLGEVIVAWETLPEQYRQLPPQSLVPAIVEQLIRQTAMSQAEKAEDHPRIVYALRHHERSLLANAAVEGILSQEVSNVELAEAYDAEYGTAERQNEYNASHILVESEEEAKELIIALQAGSDFAALAKEKSTGPSGPSGGSLGWFGQGMMVPEFEQAVMALEKGAVSEPIQTQFGWHVILLNDAREQSLPSIEDVRDELAAMIQQKRVEAQVEAIVTSQTIERLDLPEVSADLFTDTTIFQD